MPKRTGSKPRVLDATGQGLGDARLLAQAMREAQAWQTRVKAGKTEADRQRPVSTSGCGGTEQPLASLPIEVAQALESELYGTSSERE